MAQITMRVPMRRIRFATWAFGAFARAVAFGFHALTYLYPAGILRPHVTISADFPEVP